MCSIVLVNSLSKTGCDVPYYYVCPRVVGRGGGQWCTLDHIAVMSDMPCVSNIS